MSSNSYHLQEVSINPFNTGNIKMVFRYILAVIIVAIIASIISSIATGIGSAAGVNLLGIIILSTVISLLSIIPALTLFERWDGCHK
jgi:hypothetical protein